MPEIKARNVAFRLPTSTHNIRQCTCYKFQTRVLVPYGLYNDRISTPSHFKAFRDCLSAFLYPPEEMIPISSQRKKFLRKLSCMRKRIPRTDIHYQSSKKIFLNAMYEDRRISIA